MAHPAVRRPRIPAGALRIALFAEPVGAADASPELPAAGPFRNFESGQVRPLALTPDGAVAVVEVKSRRGPWPPEERIDARKRERLSRAALALSVRGGLRERRFQFDVVAVNLVDGRPPGVRHWPGAFDASAPGP